MGDRPQPQRETTEESSLREQCRLACLQARRSPLSIVIVDGFIVWICAPYDRAYAALLWMAISGVFQAIRRIAAGRLLRVLATQASAAVVSSGLERSNLFSLLLGSARGASFLVLFLGFPEVPLSLGTTATLALAAGATASFAGLTRPYLLWSIPVFGAVIAVWAMNRNQMSLTACLLFLLLQVVLWAHVRDQARLIRQSIGLARELQIERDRAQAASDSKTRFFASASHDLRQPLHALSINATTLELVASRDGSATMKELSHSIGRALRESNALLDNLLDISMLEANSVRVSIEPMSIRPLLQSLSDEFGPIAAQRGLNLLVADDGPDIWVATDRKQFRRILANLVSNALKFTEHGSVRIDIRSEHASVGAGEGLVTVSVIDTGLGIEAAEHERVFEDFYQIGNRSRDRTRGLGLGLSIVRRAASLLGAEVTLQSTPGLGSCFEVVLPACTPPAPEQPTERRQSFESPLSHLRLDAHVLAVDDEPEILNALRGLLPLFGCTVRCAGNLNEALGIVASGFRPHVLIVDHRLGAHTGNEIVAALRQRLGSVPAVLVTGDTDPALSTDEGALGMRVVHKPLDGGLLVEALTRSLEDADEAVKKGQ